MDFFGHFLTRYSSGFNYQTGELWVPFVSYLEEGVRSREHKFLMSAMAYQIASLMIVCSTLYSAADQRKY